MTKHRRGDHVFAACTLFFSLLLAPSPMEASSGRSARARFVREARALMADLRAESRADSARMREAYEEYLSDERLRDRAALARALNLGEIAYLPAETATLNINTRLSGAHPIGEKDLAHQELYVAARPEAIGLLMQVAARVTSAPVEVTSLVRHDEYQRALSRTNRNARTEVPTHTTGLAFDISILNMPLPAVRELRDVLLQMRADGDLLFIAEVRQLVFHVMPAPNRLDYFRAMYEVMSTTPPPALPDGLPWLTAPPIDMNPQDLMAASTIPSDQPWVWTLALLGLAGMLWPMRRRERRKRSRPQV